MKYTWNDFKVMHGGVEGARAAFEQVCESLYRKIYSSVNVQQVEVKQGDGGIDIFIGEIGINPITVIQCKFFIDEFGNAQQNQIRESFKSAINSTEYQLEKWILCIPIVLSLKPNQWWSRWKDKTISENNKNDEFIQLRNGNELLDLLKTNGLYDEVFDIENSLRIKDIHKAICSSTLRELSNSEQYTYDESLLKAAYLMTKGNELLTSTHKRLFDTIICVLIYDLACVHNKRITTKLLYEEFKKAIRLNIDIPKLESTLNRLIKRQLIKLDNEFLKVTDDFSESINNSNNELTDDLNTITRWILEDLQKALGVTLNAIQRSQIEKNSIESIVLFHKLYAYSVLVENAEVSPDQLNTSLITRVQNNLESDVSDHLLLIIGRLLNTPTREQGIVLDRIRKTYLGLQLLGLDPKVHSIRGVSFSGKTYILDTDFVLNLIASHSLKSSSYRRIVEILIENDAKIKIPTEILEEVCYHARYAPRSYHYFAGAYDRLDRDLLLQKVNNVFVESYFNRPPSENSLSLDAYIHNFYDERDSVGFVTEFIKDEVSNNIEFFSLEGMAGNNIDGLPFLADLEEGILELTLKTEKSGFRDEDENKRIARTDALMYALHYKNETNGIITTSTRALRVAKELSIYNKKLYIKPHILLSYMELEVSNNIDYSDISSILFNPFIQFAVNDGWDDIKKVIDLGGDLRGVKVTRLKRDLQGISEKLLYSDNVGEVTESDLAVVGELYKKDYKFNGAINELITEMNETKIENEELKAKLREFEEKENKKNKYLKRYNRNKQ